MACIARGEFRMIRLTNVVARFAPIQVGPVTLRLGPGGYALLGRPSDGVGLLLEAIAGRVLLASGKVETLGAPPAKAQTRRGIGYVALDAPLPETMRVSSVFALAAKIRGEDVGDVAERLGKLGVAALAKRSVVSLSLEERRAVAVAEAITSTKTQLLLIEEPFSSMDARTTSLLPKILRQRAAAGTCVVISTASTRDPLLVADEAFAFDRGKLVWRGKPADRVALARGESVRVQVLASDVRALAAALAKDERAMRVVIEPGLLSVEGHALVDIAAAIATAARSSQSDVLSIVPDAAPFDDLLASVATRNP
ncbi:MAG: ATP-binding cassette domain-containing protein [Polyangiaceae bacterium]